jgi:hypothetical protein
LSESHSETLSSTPDEREKTESEFLKENRKEFKIEENDKEEMKRFVNHWNAICTECNEPTLAWLQGDLDRFATRLVEVIRQLRIPEMPARDALSGPQSR